MHLFFPSDWFKASTRARVADSSRTHLARVRVGVRVRVRVRARVGARVRVRVRVRYHEAERVHQLRGVL